MKKENEKTQKIKESIITLLDSVVDIVNNTDIKNPNAKKCADAFTNSSTELLKKFCDKIGANYDEIYSNFIDDKLNKIIKEELLKARNTKPKKVNKTWDEDGKALFEPLMKEEHLLWPSDKEQIKENKSENEHSAIVSDNPCVLTCDNCLFTDICFIKKTKNIKKETPEKNNNSTPAKINIVNISNNVNTADNTNKNGNSIIQNLRNEYNDLQNQNNTNRDNDNTQEIMKLKKVPGIYTKRIFDMLSDKKAHNYKFIKGTDKANPAVEITIEDDYNVGTNLGIMTVICDNIKKEGGFSLVTASKAEQEQNMSYITFYLVLY